MTQFTERLKDALLLEREQFQILCAEMDGEELQIEENTFA